MIRLADGRTPHAALDRFPLVGDATPEQRAHWELIEPGIGIHWPDLDEDISVAGLIGLPD